MNPKPVRILLVDDSPSIVKSLERILHNPRAGWDIRMADNGESALELCKESPFEIVVTDLNMPGMNGAELIRKVRELHPATRSMVLCGDPGSPEATELAEQGYLIIEKPCPGSLLRTAIADEIEKLRNDPP